MNNYNSLMNMGLCGVFEIQNEKKHIILVVSWIFLVASLFFSFRPLGFTSVLAWGMIVACAAAIFMASKKSGDKVVAIDGTIERFHGEDRVFSLRMQDVSEWHILVGFSSEDTGDMSSLNFSDATLSCSDTSGQVIVFKYAENRNLFREVLGFLQVHNNDPAKSAYADFASRFPSNDFEIQAIFNRWRVPAVGTNPP